METFREYTDIIYYDALTRMNDADTYTNTLSTTFDLRHVWLGLAYYIAIKDLRKSSITKSVYEEEFQRAVEDRDRSSTTIEI